MHRRIKTRPAGSRARSGKILAMTVLLFPILLGTTGLVVDSGMLMAAHRQAQNAADAAATAAAMARMQKSTDNQILTLANDFLGKHQLPGKPTLVLNSGTVNTVNMPPKQGPYAGKTQYVEVVVSARVSTMLIHILGVNSDQHVVARAVAGYQPESSGEGVILLDPRANTYGGLSVSGGTKLVLTGALIVNSRGRGVDQFEVPVTSTYNDYAISTGNNSVIYSPYVKDSGGVDVLQNMYNYADYPGTIRNSAHPLFARAALTDDPLRNLPVPQVSTEGVARLADGSILKGTQGAYNITNSSGAVRFSPGIYSDIRISNGANVTFEPGVYVLSPNSPNEGLRINGDPTVYGDGVLFYFAGSNYKLNGLPAGLFDILDNPIEMNLATETLPNPPDVNWKQVEQRLANLDINVNGGNVVLNGLKNPSSAFDDVLFFFRRRNSNTVASLAANSGDQLKLNGTIYAKWGNFKLSGSAQYDARFVVGSMDVSGGTTMTIDNAGRSFDLATLTYMVE